MSELISRRTNSRTCAGEEKSDKDETGERYGNWLVSELIRRRTKSRTCAGEDKSDKGETGEVYHGKCGIVGE